LRVSRPPPGGRATTSVNVPPRSIQKRQPPAGRAPGVSATPSPRMHDSVHAGEATTRVRPPERRPVYSVAVSAPSPQKRLKQAADLLDDFYGRPVLSPRYPPVDELVFTVLSQNTADVNTERTFASLKARFPEWTAARDAVAEEIEAAIALGGLSHTKAPRIKKILEAISERTGAPDLGELDGMTDQQAQDYLVALPGVGPKTAACVLLFALGRPVMPVDTHVHRVARRLGIIDQKVTAEQAHPLLTRLAGPDDAAQVYAVHVDFVRHGRRICHARRPACGDCPLARMCPSAGLV
jgi:endonuclease-3